MSDNYTWGRVAPNSANPEVAVNDALENADETVKALEVRLATVEDLAVDPESGEAITELPPGGEAGQVLSVVTAGSTRSLAWITLDVPDAPEAGEVLPAGGTTGQVLVITGTNPTTYGWADDKEGEDGAVYPTGGSLGQVLKIVGVDPLVVEWRDDIQGTGDTGGGNTDDPGTAVIAASRPAKWWRVRWIAGQGGTGPASIAEVYMASVAGGPNLCTGGTYDSSTYQSGGQAADAAFDGGLGAGWAARGTRLIGEWIAYGFATPQNIKEVKLAAGNPADNAPSVFAIEFSDDGEGWFTACVTGARDWSGTKAFKVPDIVEGGGGGGGSGEAELPEGGAVGQVLKVASLNPRVLAWADDNQGTPGISLPPNAAPGKVLKVQSINPLVLYWADDATGGGGGGSTTLFPRASQFQDFSVYGREASASPLTIVDITEGIKITETTTDIRGYRCALRQIPGELGPVVPFEFGGKLSWIPGNGQYNIDGLVMVDAQGHIQIWGINGGNSGRENVATASWVTGGGQWVDGDYYIGSPSDGPYFKMNYDGSLFTLSRSADGTNYVVMKTYGVNTTRVGPPVRYGFLTHRYSAGTADTVNWTEMFCTEFPPA